MSAAAILAVRRAVVGALNADATLASLMGGSVRLFDEPPRAARGLYAVFGDATARDWSTGSDTGSDQTIAIVVWSVEGGAAPALAVAGRIAETLHEAELEPPGHRLVSLRAVSTDVVRDKPSGLVRITLRLRALTETE